ncbi:MAG TPA: saccharopine dehydrogenase C-terminal domain-containing protein [Bacteroidia bacterium]|nr:saccharopine dehydrogenase C-terminal domain-containing protein [Bacteroidia bacterium]HNU34040.1 saccharopine dehydrogenase C-terminal domain-containing protein [Bacteroidia bacterium]
MRNILVLGAGKSSPYLIKYFLDNASSGSWNVTVADNLLSNAQQKIGNNPLGNAVQVNINDDEQRKNLIAKADIVVSLLPPALHEIIADNCLELNKNLATASYVSLQMQARHHHVFDKGLIFLNECGLDPGLDHMSAMKIIEKIKADGGEIKSFKSYTGGLIAPQSNNNPWGYKFTWNPRNVILAGQSTAKFIEHGTFKYIPYQRLFSDIEKIKVNDVIYDGYANRDSLSYIKQYGLEGIPTMIRGTLRNQGFCAAWNIFVQLGLTDDTYLIDAPVPLSYRTFLSGFLRHVSINYIEEALKQFINRYTNDESVFEKIISTGITSNEVVPITNVSPAVILQQLLEKKWALQPLDLDQIVMSHIFVYNDINGKKHQLTSNLIVTGEDASYTAMAKTVGLPLAIAVKNILNGAIKLKGVVIPNHVSVYDHTLKELEKYGITFNDSGGII